MIFLELGKMQFNVQGVARNPVPRIENNIDSTIFKIPSAQFRKQQMKLIKTKKITSKSEMLLH